MDVVNAVALRSPAANRPNRVLRVRAKEADIWVSLHCR
jgi:hypothetical protein